LKTCNFNTAQGMNTGANQGGAGNPLGSSHDGQPAKTLLRKATEVLFTAGVTPAKRLRGNRDEHLN